MIKRNKSSLEHLSTIIRMVEDELIRDFDNQVPNKVIDDYQKTLSNLRKEYQIRSMRALK